jgi:hypothetical protein
LKEVSKKIACAWLGMIAVVGVIGLLVTRELSKEYYQAHPGGNSSPLDLYEYALLGVVAVLCLGYTTWVFVSWALKRARRPA